MSTQDILLDIEAGESKPVELKIELPEKSEKYIKAIVAFANTAGGRLTVGVRNNDRAIIGVENPEVVIDTIANALADTVKPMMTPDIYRVDIEGKSLVVAEIFPGNNCPYYIASKGKEAGTYIKVGATTRLADDPILRELEFRGASQSFDEQVYVGAKYDEQAAVTLCEAIDRYREESAEAKGQPKSTKWTTPKNLENWKLLRRVDGELVPTRAFMLMTDNPFEFAKIQCGQFKGSTRSVFLDKRTYEGNLYGQLEEAAQFVLRNIRFGAEIIGMLRHESYELPIVAIREAIVNAIIHRSYLQNSCVQVALFDDRLEVSSPGALFGDLTLEKALEGSAALRNPRVAKVFEKMELYESWGTGLQRIQDSCKEHGLPKPEFLEIGSMFRVNIFRPQVESASQSASDQNVKLKETQKSLAYNVKEIDARILDLLRENPNLSRRDLAQLINVSESTIYRRLSSLKNDGVLEYIGKPRKGYWLVGK